MSESYEEELLTGSSNALYLDAAAAGVVAGVVFGLGLQFLLGGRASGNAMTTIGALYTLGEPSLSIGWIAHLINSALFALVFALVTGADALSPYVEAPTSGLVLGAGYGAILWFVNIGFVWPLWLSTVGVRSLSVPHFAVGPLVGHLAWGGLLGVLFPLLRSRRGG